MPVPIFIGGLHVLFYLEIPGTGKLTHKSTAHSSAWQGYERDEVLPSIEVDAKIAHVLEVFLDYLAGNSKKAAVNKKTMKLIYDIEDLEPAIKDKLIFLVNAVIRDAKTGKDTDYWWKTGKAYA
ncbi:MAG: hypothetical protein ABI760_24770 [Ferruginibacter sp.]